VRRLQVQEMSGRIFHSWREMSGRDKKVEYFTDEKKCQVGIKSRIFHSWREMSGWDEKVEYFQDDQMSLRKSRPKCSTTFFFKINT
jgi:hypothetical protein